MQEPLRVRLTQLVEETALLGGLAAGFFLSPSAGDLGRALLLAVALMIASYGIAVALLERRRPWRPAPARPRFERSLTQRFVIDVAVLAIALLAGSGLGLLDDGTQPEPDIVLRRVLLVIAIPWIGDVLSLLLPGGSVRMPEPPPRFELPDLPADDGLPRTRWGHERVQ